MRSGQWSGLVLVALLLPAASTEATPCADVQAQLRPGYVVTIDEGATCSQAFTLPVGSGLAGAGAGATLDTGGADRPVTATDGGTIVLRNLTIRHGKAPAGDRYGVGGALLTGDVSAQITDVRFAHNSGGGLVVDSTATAGVIAITGSAFTHNTDARSGGGLYVHTDSDIVVAGTTVRDNTARPVNGSGGGALLLGNGVSVVASTFEHNVLRLSTGIGGGGGLAATGTKGVHLTDNAFRANRIVGGRLIAGAGAQIDGPATLLRDSFVGNALSPAAQASGSALSLGGNCRAAPVISLANEQIFANRAGAAAAVDVRCADLYVISSTIGRNRATSGPISLSADAVSTLTVLSSIFDEYPTATIGGFASRAISFTDACTDNAPVKGEGNICLLAALRARGHDDALGETRDSPTIDEGTNALDAIDPAKDNEGFARIIDGDGDRTADIDMGASELQSKVRAGGRPVIVSGGVPVAVRAGRTYRVRTGWMIHCQRGRATCATTVNGRRARTMPAGGHAQPAFLLSASQARTLRSTGRLKLKLIVTARARRGRLVRVTRRVVVTPA